MTQPKSVSLPPMLGQIAAILSLAIAYYIFAQLSRELASTPQSVTPVWPPDGIAVGAMLLWGQGVGLGVFLGSFFANFWAFQDGSSLLSWVISGLPALGIALGTTLGTYLGTGLVQKFTHHRYPLARVSDVFKFLILAGLVGPLVNATVGVLSLSLNGKLPWSAYGSVWVTWWISNVSGIVIVTPILLSWGQLLQQNRRFIRAWFTSKTAISGADSSLPRQSISTQRYPGKIGLIAELLLLLGCVILISKIAFGDGYHLEYILIPLLIWSAFRFGQAGATLLTFVVAAIAVIGTVNGQGGFASADLNQSLAQLQSFIGVITLTILVLTATIAERSQAENQLRLAFAELAHTNETLEERVQQRTQELNEKNITLNQTLETLKKTQLQMLHSEKMSALGQMVAGVAHEINNPINFIYGNLVYLEAHIQGLIQGLQAYQQHYPHPSKALQTQLDELDLDFLKSDLAKILQSMNSGADRIRTIVLSLRNFSRLGESEIKAVDLHEGIENTLVILQHRLKATSDRPAIQVMKEYGNLPLVECDAGSLNQVFMNLLTNAIDALDEAQAARSQSEISATPSTILIQTQPTDDNQVRITISDNGTGISEEIRSKLFDPFFTTKPVGKGTGLGLSMSYQIVTEQHRGNLWYDATFGQGATFIIEIPIQSTANRT